MNASLFLYLVRVSILFVGCDWTLCQVIVLTRQAKFLRNNHQPIYNFQNYRPRFYFKWLSKETLNVTSEFSDWQLEALKVFRLYLYHVINISHIRFYFIRPNAITFYQVILLTRQQAKFSWENLKFLITTNVILKYSPKNFLILEIFSSFYFKR